MGRRKKDEILLSEKYGANPSLDLCFWCGEPKGIVLLGKLKGDVEAPGSTVTSYEPCNKCKERMAQGVTFMSCSEQPMKEGQPPIQKNPDGSVIYPTGKLVVVKKDKFIEVAEKYLGMNEEIAKSVEERGKCFLDSQAFDIVFQDAIKNMEESGDE